MPVCMVGAHDERAAPMAQQHLLVCGLLCSPSHQPMLKWRQRNRRVRRAVRFTALTDLRRPLWGAWVACPVQSAPACNKSWLASSARTSPLPPLRTPLGSHIAVVQLSSVASSSCRLRFCSRTCTTSLFSTPLFNGILGVDIVFGHLNNQEKNWTNDKQSAQSHSGALRGPPVSSCGMPSSVCAGDSTHMNNVPQCH